MDVHIDPETTLPFEALGLDAGLGEHQIKRTQAIRQSRAQAEATIALREIKQVAVMADSVMPAVMRGIRA